MKVATWNVNGIRARQAQVLEWIAAEAPDILCLQELKAGLDQIPMELVELDDYWCYWHGQKGYSGVGLHLSKAWAPVRPAFSHPPFDYECRIVSAELGPLTALSCYVPNGGKDFPGKMRFLADLESYVGELISAGRQVLLCGDLNVARADIDVHPKERKKTAVGQLPEEREALERLLARGLVDVTRQLHPDDHDLFTWWAPWRNLRQKNIGWRIDYILASPGLQAQECRSLREVGTSDHGPLVAVF